MQSPSCPHAGKADFYVAAQGSHKQTSKINGSCSQVGRMARVRKPVACDLHDGLTPASACRRTLRRSRDC
eukprot:1507054-Pyramimonas_sp.AAC.1